MMYKLILWKQFFLYIKQVMICTMATYVAGMNFLKRQVENPFLLKSLHCLILFNRLIWCVIGGHNHSSLLLSLISPHRCKWWPLCSSRQRQRRHSDHCHVQGADPCHRDNDHRSAYQYCIIIGSDLNIQRSDHV